MADETSLKDVHDEGTACTTDDHVNVKAIKCTREQLIQAQEEDAELHPLIDDVVGKEEVHKYANCFYRQSGVLIQKWRPPEVPANEEWQMSYQIVLPWKFQEEVLSIARASPMAGHLGVNKTYCKLLTHFYWPKRKCDVAQFCRTCHVRQVVGELNQTIPVAPLKPVPVYGEPFSDNLSIVWGPSKSGNKFWLLLCASLHYQKQFPSIAFKANKTVDALVKFFTSAGLPKSVQSNQGSNLMSGFYTTGNLPTWHQAM